MSKEFKFEVKWIDAHNYEISIKADSLEEAIKLVEGRDWLDENVPYQSYPNMIIEGVSEIKN